MPSDATFDIVHSLDDWPVTLFHALPRGEALEIVEERICTGQMTGRRFRIVAMHQYVSPDGRAKLTIVRTPPTSPIPPSEK